MTFGKHSGETFQEVWEKDIKYCHWVIQIAEEQPSSCCDGLKDLAVFIYQKMADETHEADDFQMELDVADSML